MNLRPIFFTGLVSTAIGIGLGVVLTVLIPNRFTSQPYRKLRLSYPIAGAIGGFLLGAGQAAVKQLKAEADALETEMEQTRSRLPKKE